MYHKKLRIFRIVYLSSLLYADELTFVSWYSNSSPISLKHVCFKICNCVSSSLLNFSSTPFRNQYLSMRFFISDLILSRIECLRQYVQESHTTYYIELVYTCFDRTIYHDWLKTCCCNLHILLFEEVALFLTYLKYTKIFVKPAQRTPILKKMWMFPRFSKIRGNVFHASHKKRGNESTQKKHITLNFFVRFLSRYFFLCN